MGGRPVRCGSGGAVAQGSSHRAWNPRRTSVRIRPAPPPRCGPASRPVRCGAGGVVAQRSSRPTANRRTSVRIRPAPPPTTGRTMGPPGRDGPPRWVRLRGYAVPPAMIANATAAREAGDWRGACAAAGVDVAVDLVGVRRESTGAAPPTPSRTTSSISCPISCAGTCPGCLTSCPLNPWTSVVLRPARRDAPFLIVSPPDSLRAPQRLTLRTTRRRALKDRRYFDAPRRLWDGRRAAELRHAWGGSDHRPPLLQADASPMPADRVGAGGDRAAHTERILAMMAAGQHGQAWREAGIDLDSSEPSGPGPAVPAPRGPGCLAGGPGRGGPTPWPSCTASAHSMSATRLRAGDGLGGPGRIGRGPADGPETPRRNQPHIAEPVYRVPPDLSVLRHSRITPHALHPLVRASAVSSTRAGTVAATGPRRAGAGAGALSW